MRKIDALRQIESRIRIIKTCMTKDPIEAKIYGISMLRLRRERNYMLRRDPLKDRELLKNEIERNAVDGMIAISHWGRDCECVESTYMDIIPATVTHYNAEYDMAARNAEGPFGMAILTPEQADAFEPEWRDRGLEHFEEYGW